MLWPGMAPAPPVPRARPKKIGNTAKQRRDARQLVRKCLVERLSRAVRVLYDGASDGALDVSVAKALAMASSSGMARPAAQAATNASSPRVFRIAEMLRSCRARSTGSATALISRRSASAAAYRRAAR